MDFFTASNSTITSRGLPTAMDLDIDRLQSTMVTFLPPLMALGFLLFLSYTPSVPKGVPEFTKEKYPFIGSYRFFSHKLSFWKTAVAGSKTGQFSFWYELYNCRVV